ncbi:type I toxin-antitoxin system Fst family toxin [Companilactobacillus nuruki]
MPYNPATDWGCIYLFNSLFAPLVVGLVTAWFTDWLKRKNRK